MKKTKFLPTDHSFQLGSQCKTTMEDENPSSTISHNAHEITHEFLRSTSIHGLRYLGEGERSVFERAFWLLFVTAGCVFSVYGCYLEWYKWHESPVLITRDPTVITHDPLSFPVVTVCSTNKISKKKLAAIIREPKFRWMNYTNLARVVRYMVKFDALLSQDDDLKGLLHSLSEHNVSVHDIVQAIQQASPTCQDIFLDCQWKSSVVDCDKLFSQRLTDDGFCCSSDIDVLNKDQSSSCSSTVYEYGIHSALRLVLDPNPFDTAVSTVAFDGFKVLLHNDGEFPDVMERGFIVGAGHENYVALNSYTVSYTPDVTKISFEKRQCYVDGEKSLVYFKNLNYTRSSCLYECRSTNIFKECGCLPFFIEANNSVPNCSFEAYDCVAEFYGGNLVSMANYCNCPASCKDHWFTTEISSVAFSPLRFSESRAFQRLVKSKKVNSNNSGTLVGLRIFFKYNAGDSFKMDVPFGNKELLASMGGLLGFGLGFSIISAVEICYFLCCRWCFRKKKERLKSSPFKNQNWTMDNADSSYRKHSSRTVRVAPVKGGTIACINAVTK